MSTYGKGKTMTAVTLLAVCAALAMMGCNKGAEDQPKNEAPETQQLRKEKQGD